MLSLTYAIGLAVVYSALGLFAGLTGTLFGAVSTNPWLYFAMANLLVLAGLAYLVNSGALLLAPAFAKLLFPAIMLPVFIGELAFALWLCTGRTRR